ncbi:uncharacterized protein LOC116428775 isoform X2 [Nomia melanderi]|uniref:uncharacterized protein LOC116428775 isoform X2 n=1 Tax=Nomia melanderi TaxID=2448451 RepID=UPI0013045491|nr:uncharacterized protein LOC116428775 isoform X2 [Nomia melanderi]
MKESIFFGVLTTKVLRDFQPGTSLQSPPLRYLPTTNTVLPKLSQHAVFVNQALDNGLEDVAVSSRSFAERQTQDGYSYLKPLLIDLEIPSKDQEIKLIADKQRSPKEIQDVRVIATTKVPNTSRSSRTDIRYNSQVPQRTSYHVVEEHNEYPTDNPDHSQLPYTGKVLTRSPYRNSQDVTATIKALDHFLSGVLNGDSYNSELHPPSNPILALILSRYGRYVLGARSPRVYAHMAVNNIHNNKPFGIYKLECEELPTYNRR